MQIGGWARPWNVKGERKVGEAPPPALLSHRPERISVKSTVSAQLRASSTTGAASSSAPDLVWRDGRFTTVRDTNKGLAFRNRKATDNAALDRLVRNAYKVSLTRGMTGTVLYSPDPDNPGCYS